MFSYSNHLLKQIAIRNISITEIKSALNNPDQKKIEDGLVVYQQVITYAKNKYLLRIFVNEEKVTADGGNRLSNFKIE